MRSKDTSLMEKIITEIDAFYAWYGRAPSTRELSIKVGLSHNSVARYLREMSEKGMLEYSDGNVITEKMSKSKSDSVTVPILGSISCGIPLTEEENVESYVRLPTELVGRGDFFFLKANGDSMVNAGIDDGDLVLIKKATEANDGDIVVALVDNENTLKRFYYDAKLKKVILHPENDGMQNIEADECQIQGVAVKVLKDLQSGS